MTPSADALMARLAAVDPARDLKVDGAARDTLWRRILAGEPAPGTRPAPRRSRAGWRSALLVGVALLIVASAALAAGGVIRFGAPAANPRTNPRAGLGAVAPGTVHQLPISIPDPAGGPPWGLRVFSTTRAGGCVQVGRLVDGRLGALGQDGAFGDDGQFHEVPAASAFAHLGCTTLDANRRLFTNVTVGDESASAWFGHLSCVPYTSSPSERSSASSICPQADERNLYYGLLGPQAASVTYVIAGRHHTMATVGPWGAYLIVTRASPKQLFNFAAGGTTGVVPVDGPITELHYRNGATCHLTARSWMGGADACTPALRVPVGYVAPTEAVTSSGQVAAPVHVQVIHETAADRYEAVVSFTSRIAVTHVSHKYLFKWHTPTMPPQVNSYEPVQTDVAPGQAVTVRLGQLGPPLPAGITRGTVALVETGEHEEPGLLVGTFFVHIP